MQSAGCGDMQMTTSPDSERLTKLIETLSSSDSDTREAAAIEVLEMGEKAVDNLIAALKHTSWQVRYYSAWALGQIGDKRAVEPLIVALHDENDTVQDWATSALGEIGDKRAVEPLIEALKHHGEKVRYNAATALGYIKDERAVEPLIAAL